MKKSMTVISAFDRAGTRRRDAAWLEAQLRHPDSRFIPCWRSRSFVAVEDDVRPVFLSAIELEGLFPAVSAVVFLGVVNGFSCFTLDLPAADESIPQCFSAFGSFQNLRSLLHRVREEDYSLLAYARAMTFWQQRNRHCGDCGSVTTSMEGGHLLVCSNPSCGRQHFPRTDPAVIMRVCQGERCLMARQASWPAGLFSVLAGFVEPGETLEEAVKREVREESGIIVRQVRYLSSQAWPFPGSLMLGFTAELESGEIYCADNELEEVCWFSRTEVRQGIKQGSLQLPVMGTLSYRLISDWLDA